MDTIISHQTPQAPVAAACTTPDCCRILEDSPEYAPLKAFFAEGHDEDIANWPTAEFAEYGRFASEYRRTHGGQR